MPSFLAAPAKLPASTARTNPTTPRILFTAQHSKPLVSRDNSRIGLNKSALCLDNLAPQTALEAQRMRSMKILSLPSAGLVLAILFHTTPAAAGDGVVGTATLELENGASGRKVTAELWFKAAPVARFEWFSPRPPLRPIRIARNADPQPYLRKHPLIVVSHGNWGSRFSQGWLALELVKVGYVVLSTSHLGTVGDDQTVAGRYRLWDRSRDVSFAVDELLKNSQWAALIDESRIGFVGHSFGGWTGVSLAGGRYDPARQRGFCQSAEKKDFYCDGTLKDDITGVPAKDAMHS